MTGLIEQVTAARQREIQMIGAAISTRSWDALESAYNQLRDKMDDWIIVPARSGIEAQHGLNDVFPGDPYKVRAGDYKAADDAELTRLREQLAHTIMQQDEEWQEMKRQSAAKDTEIARLRDALAFYADRDGDGYQVDVTNYGLSTEEGEIVRDGGKRARTALQSIIDVEASLDSGRGQTFSPEQGGE